MTSLTLIVDGEPTTLCRPVRRGSAHRSSGRTMGLMLDMPVEPGDGEGWWVEEDVPSPWRRDELMRVFSAGMPVAARAILEEIARQPDGYPFDDLHRALGMNRLAVAATLGSAGETAAPFPGKPALVRQDHRARTYYMPCEVATFLVPRTGADDVEAVEDGVRPDLMSDVTRAQARCRSEASNRLP